MSVLQHYRSLREASGRMLVEASAGRWDEVERIERECAALIDALRARPERLALSREDDRERLRILCDIVRIDAQVRQLAQPWLATLDRVLGGARAPRGDPDEAPRA